MIQNSAYKCILVFFALTASAAFAQANESLRIRVNEPRAEGDQPPGTYFLKLTDSEYVSAGQSYYRQGADSGDRSVSVGGKKDFTFGAFGARLNLRDDYSATERWNYLKAYEANISVRPTELNVVTAGRKLDRWNEWEADWHQGLFQPRYMQNKLRSEEAGLAGIFYNHNTNPVSFAVGFLPMHLPDFGAHFYVEDDRFVSRNPWFNPPASQFEYREVAGDIRYSLNKPTLSEASSHMGGVAKVEFNGAKNYFARLAAAYKPMPQFLLGFPSRNRVLISGTEDYMSVEVTPRIAYHTLISHDSVFRAGAWTIAGSLMTEIPDRFAAPGDFTAQSATQAWIASASISRPLEEEGSHAARVQMGFLKVDGGDAPDRGDFAGRESLFERRYQYNEAYSLGISKPWRMGRFPLDTQARLIYDRLQNGGVASFTVGMNFSRAWRADLEADFLGLFAGPAEINDGFLALYRANDRVGLGVSYVY